MLVRPYVLDILCEFNHMSQTATGKVWETFGEDAQEKIETKRKKKFKLFRLRRKSSKTNKDNSNNAASNPQAKKEME